MDSEKKPQQPDEQEAVFTTIVGGRPPGSGTRVGATPRGVEVLLKKASVDAAFRELLLKERGEAARRIDLELTDAEREMLASVPAEQLEKIIDNTKVKPEHKSAFLGTVGRVMLATVVAGAAFVTCVPTATAGISPDKLRRMQMAQQSDANDPNNPNDPNASDPNLREAEQGLDAREDIIVGRWHTTQRKYVPVISRRSKRGEGRLHFARAFGHTVEELVPLDAEAQVEVIRGAEPETEEVEPDDEE